MDKWIVSVVKARYEDATTKARVNGRKIGAGTELN